MDTIANYGDETDKIHALSEKISEIKNSQDALESLTKSTNLFSKVASGASALASTMMLVNCTVSFLKLIGVMEDPTQTALNNILDKVTTMDERMQEMDKKLNDITASMARIESSVEFNARTQKAEALTDRWTNFRQTYL